jgi:hypothetical protein
MRLFGSNSKPSNLSHTFHRNHSSPLSVRENKFTASASARSIDAKKNEERIQKLLEKDQNECTSKEKRLIRRYKSRLSSDEGIHLRSDQIKAVDIVSDINNNLNNKQEDSIFFHNTDTKNMKQNRTLVKENNKSNEQTLIEKNRKGSPSEYLLNKKYTTNNEKVFQVSSHNIIFDDKKTDEHNIYKIKKYTNYKQINNREKSVRNKKKQKIVTNLKFKKIKKNYDLSNLPLLERKCRLENRKLQFLLKKSATIKQPYIHIN